MVTGRLVAIGALLAVSGCLYIAPINERPHAQIERLNDGPFLTQQAIEFSAEGSADDSGAIEASWFAEICDDVEREVCDPLPVGVGERFQVVSPRGGELFVDLTIEDRHGAVARDTETITVSNRTPVVALEAFGPRVVDGAITVFARGEDAESPEVTLVWSLSVPDTSVSAVFEAESLTEYRLVPDVPGAYEVKVTAVDSEGGESEVALPLAVLEDSPPCVRVTDPPTAPEAIIPLDRGEGPRRFAVLRVQDDLDAYPRAPTAETFEGETELRWRLATPASSGVLEEAGEDSAIILDPSFWAPGDRLTLRLDASDRVARSGCGEGEPFCNLSDNCRQRVTWVVEVR